ncbi:MAG TPA: short-chain dehydrogenase [Solibacterales bacterium]|nr:short-chain dehydrogenase [Bryobacterales bacterium]
MSASPKLEGKIVLVTGAAKRIGREIALRLASEGARVALHYGESREEAERTAAECGGAELFQADLESVPQIRRLFEQVRQRCGGLDGLVNNAARFTRFNVLEIEENDWDYVHSVNLKATFFCCQSAARMMQPGGRIVNISSLGGLRPWAEHVHYCASKAGVIMLTKALSKALAPGITVNTVAPGVIPFGESDERIEAMVRATPMQRAGKGSEIADAVVYFLTCPDFITGQLLAVTGGLEHR